MRENNQGNYIYGETWSAEAPAPTRAVYEILAEHVSKGGNDEESHLALNDVYKALAESEGTAVRALDELERKGTISREDSLTVTVLLAAFRTLGPDLDFLRQAIIRGSFDPSRMDTALEECGLDKRIIEHMKEVLAKLKVSGAV